MTVKLWGAGGGGSGGGRSAIRRAAVRAAEQDARLGKPEALALYDAEIAAIKAAVPKG